LTFEPRNLRIVPLSSLIPHEKVIHENSERIKESMNSEGIQKDPIIVEKDTLIVLDGTHRMNAMKEIGLEYAVCYLLPYSSESIKLERWVRTVPNVGKEIEYLLEALDVNEKVSVEKAYEMTEKNSVAFLSERNCFIKSFNNIQSAYSLIERFEQATKVIGLKTGYIREDEVDIAMKENKIVILGPRIKKQDVVEAARRGNLLPPKTTHHIIDPRPVSIRYPVNLLKERDVKGIEAFLTKNPRILPPESIYEGRVYKESLIILSEL
jgi:hypothetical protein